MAIDVKKTGNKLSVDIKVNPSKKNMSSVAWSTEKVLKWIETNHPEYKIEETIKSSFVHSAIDNDHLSGQWIFKLKTKEQPKTTKKRRTKTQSKKEHVTTLNQVLLDSNDD